MSFIKRRMTTEHCYELLMKGEAIELVKDLLSVIMKTTSKNIFYMISSLLISLLLQSLFYYY